MTAAPCAAVSCAAEQLFWLPAVLYQLVVAVIHFLVVQHDLDDEVQFLLKGSMPAPDFSTIQIFYLIKH